MDEAIRDCLVAGYERRVESLVLPDPDDRHVVAAAIEAEARVIVTFNLRDFPEDALSPHGLKAVHPDELLIACIEFDAARVHEALRKQRENLRNPPVSAEVLLATLEHQGLPRSVARLRPFADRF